MKKTRQTASVGMVSRLAGAGMLFAFAAFLTPLAACAEKSNVFFIHGAVDGKGSTVGGQMR